MTKPVDQPSDMTEFTAQLLKLGNQFLDFDNHGKDDAQVAGTVLADQGFVPDGFGAKRAIHQTSAHFPKFVLHRSAHLHELRKVMDH